MSHSYDKTAENLLIKKLLDRDTNHFINFFKNAFEQLCLLLLEIENSGILEIGEISITPFNS